MSRRARVEWWLGLRWWQRVIYDALIAAIVLGVLVGASKKSVEYGAASSLFAFGVAVVLLSGLHALATQPGVRRLPLPRLALGVVGVLNIVLGVVNADALLVGIGAVMFALVAVSVLLRRHRSRD